MPIIKTFEHLDYNQLLNEYKFANGKGKKPVNPREKNPVAPDTVCSRCGAPHNYIYDNAGVRDQLCCKVCDLHFSKNKVDFKTAVFIYPFCEHTLSKRKIAKTFMCINVLIKNVIST